LPESAASNIDEAIDFRFDKEEIDREEDGGF
jgi:hypothetical protein